LHWLVCPGRLRRQIGWALSRNLNALVEYLLNLEWLEATGLVSGVLCVVLLIRQNIWNWPIGLLYSLISVVVFYRSRLYADLGLHVFYVLMNGYGWYYWTYGLRRSAQVLG
jgi:nicotinamide mononucleotide transporter